MQTKLRQCYTLLYIDQFGHQSKTNLLKVAHLPHTYYENMLDYKKTIYQIIECTN